MLKRLNLFITLISIFTITGTGCSVFVSAPDQHATGAKVVCILHDDDTAFKNEVIGRIAVELSTKGYTVITDDVKRAKYYSAEEYGAVVYMAQYWMWHVPWHAKSYFKDNNNPANTIFVVTAGDPDVTIDKPFDAITSVSKDAKVDSVTSDILSRLDAILR